METLENLLLKRDLIVRNILYIHIYLYVRSYKNYSSNLLIHLKLLSRIYVDYAPLTVVSWIDLRVGIIGRISSTAAIELPFNLVISLAIAHFNSCARARLPFFLNIQFARNVNLVSSLIRLTDLLALVPARCKNER